jgi:hypothetical protein
MNSDNITKAQATVIFDALFPGANYLVRLRDRMQKSSFPPGDKLFQLVEKAHDAMRQLSSELHYMSCDGAGRPDRSE